MRKKTPLHIFQMGGVVPIEAPLMRDTEMSPLIQIASMPVDVGVGAALQFRGQQIQRDALALQEDQFSWQQEKWQQDFDYRSQQDEMMAALKMTDLFFKIVGGQMPTGITSQAARATGAAANYHTAAQQKTVNESQIRKSEMVTNWIKDVGMSGLKKDPSSLARLSTDALRLQNDETREAFEQASFYNTQALQFQKDPDKWDSGLYTHQMRKYSNSDLSFREPVLFPSIIAETEAIFDRNSKVWGTPSLAEGLSMQGIRQIIRTNPDIREAYVGYMKQAHGSTLRAKHQMENELAEENGYPDVEPYEEWVDNYLTTLGDISYRPGTDLGGHQFPKAGEESSLTIPNRSTGGFEVLGSTRGGGVYEYQPDKTIGGLDLKYAPASQEELDKLDEIYNNSLVKIFSDKTDRLSQAFTKNKAVKGSERVYLDNEIQVDNFKNAMKFTYPDTDMSKFGETTIIDGEERFKVTDEGIDAYKEYAERLTTFYRHAPESYILKNEKDRTAITDRIIANIDDMTFMDREGNMYTGENIRKRFLPEGEGKDTGDISMFVESVEDIANPYSLIAQDGNQIATGSVFGVNPIRMRFEKSLGGGKVDSERFFIPRLESYRVENPDLVGGHNAFTIATAGVGSDVELTDDYKAQIAGVMRYNGSNVANHNLIDKITHVTRPQESDNIILKYQGNTTGNVEVVNPENAGVGISLLDQVSERMDPNQHVEVIEKVNSEGPPSWYVRIDDVVLDVGVDPSLETLNNIGNQFNSNKSTVGLFEYEDIRKKANVKAGVDLNLNRGFAKDIDEYLNPILPVGYTITSGLRSEGGGPHTEGRAIDIRDTQEMRDWAFNYIPNFTKSPDGMAVWYPIPGTGFKAALHNNMDSTTKEIKPGYHFDIRSIK